MSDLKRRQVLDLFRESTRSRYSLRWTDERVTLGDFDGRDFTIDVFDIELDEELAFLALIRDARQVAKGIVGHRCQFVFHSRLETTEHYGHLFPRTAGAHVSEGNPAFRVAGVGSVLDDTTVEVGGHVAVSLKDAA